MSPDKWWGKILGVTVVDGTKARYVNVMCTFNTMLQAKNLSKLFNYN